MRKRHKIAIIATTAALIGGGIYLHSQGHIGPSDLYPNPSLTPGVAATFNASDLIATYTNCPQGKAQCTYSQAHRSVSTSEKNQVMAEYGVQSASASAGEIDHFYPLCAGGSNDIQNLWPQPKVNLWNGENWGYKVKDKLEAWVCRQIKAGKLDPKVAFQGITEDWVAYYKLHQQEIEGIQDASVKNDAEIVE